MCLFFAFCFLFCFRFFLFIFFRAVFTASLRSLCTRLRRCRHCPYVVLASSVKRCWVANAVAGSFRPPLHHEAAQSTRPAPTPLIEVYLRWRQSVSSLGVAPGLLTACQHRPSPLPLLYFVTFSVCFALFAAWLPALWLPWPALATFYLYNIYTHIYSDILQRLSLLLLLCISYEIVYFSAAVLCVCLSVFGSKMFSYCPRTQSSLAAATPHTFYTQPHPNSIVFVECIMAVYF